MVVRQYGEKLKNDKPVHVLVQGAAEVKRRTGHLYDYDVLATEPIFVDREGTKIAFKTSITPGSVLQFTDGPHTIIGPPMINTVSTATV